MGVPSGPTSPRVLSPGQSARAPGSARNLYYSGIVPIEGGTAANGSFKTSPKGAIGPGQVMPGTAPLAAKLAGVAFDDNLYRTDAAYNNKLGEAYYTEQLRKYGDPVLAAAAYNAGPGRVDRALRRAAKTGQPVENFLPAETQKYVQSFQTKIGASADQSYNANEDVSAVGQTAIPAPQMEAGVELPDMPLQAPNAPKLPDPVQSQRVQMAQQMLESGNPFLVQQARAYLDELESTLESCSFEDQLAYPDQLGTALLRPSLNTVQLRLHGCSLGVCLVLDGRSPCRTGGCRFWCRSVC